MGKFSDEYKKALESETMQFLFLCSKSDVHMLVEDYKKSNLQELVRLGALTLVFGYKRLFMKICATVEKDLQEYLGSLNILNGNFNLLESWVKNFISTMKYDEAKKLSEELWQDRKKELDIEKFSIRQLL